MNITQTAAALVLGIAVMAILFAPFTRTGGYICVLCLIFFKLCLWVLDLDNNDDGDVLNENIGDGPTRTSLGTTTEEETRVDSPRR